jgi:hypothetical protein
MRKHLPKRPLRRRSRPAASPLAVLSPARLHVLLSGSESVAGYWGAGVLQLRAEPGARRRAIAGGGSLRRRGRGERGVALKKRHRRTVSRALALLLVVGTGAAPARLPARAPCAPGGPGRPATDSERGDWPPRARAAPRRDCRHAMDDSGRRPSPEFGPRPVARPGGRARGGMRPRRRRSDGPGPGAGRPVMEPGGSSALRRTCGQSRPAGAESGGDPARPGAQAAAPASETRAQAGPGPGPADSDSDPEACSQSAPVKVGSGLFKHGPAGWSGWSVRPRRRQSQSVG